MEVHDAPDDPVCKECVAREEHYRETLDNLHELIRKNKTLAARCSRMEAVVDLTHEAPAPPYEWRSTSKHMKSCKVCGPEYPGGPVDDFCAKCEKEFEKNLEMSVPDLHELIRKNKTLAARCSRMETVVDLILRMKV